MAAASARVQNSTVAPAVPAAAHSVPVALLIAVTAGLFAVVAASIVQIAMDRSKEVSARRRAAATLKIELAMIAESIRHVDWNRAGLRGPYERRAVPRGSYDGMVGSGMLGGFDARTQELLYRFYWRASLGDHAGMNAAIGQVVLAVERVERENEPGLRAALGRAFRVRGAEVMPQGEGGGGGWAGGSVGAPIRGLGA